MGDIVHQSLSVEMGAVFEGQCRYLQDPLSQSAGGSTGSGPQVVSSSSGTRSDFGGFGQSSGDGRVVPGVVVTGTSS
jgi:hypothetical protein